MHTTAKHDSGDTLKPIHGPFEFLAWIAAPATVAFFVLAVVYEWGYFGVIGHQFQGLLATTDYFVDAVMILPFILYLSTLFLSPLPRPHHPALPLFKAITFIVVSSFLLIYPASLVFPDIAVTFVVGYALCNVWGIVAGPRVARFYPNRFYRAIRIVPIVVVAVFLAGTVVGHATLRGDTGNVYFLKSKEAGSVMHAVYLLRSIDRGVLVSDPIARQISFYRWEDVEFIRKWSFPPDPTSIECRWFGRRCPPAEPLL
jgi:hypothetical protein